jgi:putative ATP-dependent endonuclease of the OLD family
VAPWIEIEVAVADLTDEQKAKFGDYAEFWDAATDTFYDEPNPAGVDAAAITEALRITFHSRHGLPPICECPR